LNRFIFRAVPLAIVALLLMLGLAAVAPFTEIGTRVLLSSASTLFPVELEHAEGSLFGQLHLSRVAMQSEDLQLELLGIEVELELSCLWQGRLCLRHLRAAQVDIAWHGGSWHSAESQARLSIIGNRIEITDLATQDSALTLRQPGKSDPDRGDNAVQLPVELVIRRATLQRSAWDIYGQHHRAERLELDGQWLGTALVLSRVQLHSRELGVLDLQGELTLSGEWPFQLTAVANWKEGANLATTLAALLPPAQISNASAQLADFSLRGPWTLVANGNMAQQSFTLDAGLTGMGYASLQLALSAQYRVAEAQLLVEHFELRDRGAGNTVTGVAGLRLGELNQWTFAAQSDGFVLPAINDEFSGQLSGRVKASGSFAENTWTVSLGKVDLQGVVNDLSARLEGRLTFDQALQLSNSRLHADVNGAALQLTSQPQGVAIALTVEDLARWLPDSKGKLQLSALLSRELSTVTIEGTAIGLRWRDVSIARASVSGNFDLKESQTFALTIGASALSINAVSLESLQLTAEGDNGHQTLQLHSKGDVAISLAGKGLFSVKEGEGEGSLLLQGELLSLAGVVAEGYDLRGQLKVQLAGDWRANSVPSINAEMQLIQPELSKDLGDGSVVAVNWDSIGLQVDWGSSGLRLAGDALKDGLTLLSMNMALPETKQAPLSGSLVLKNLDVQPFQVLFPLLTQLHGSIDGQLQLSGTSETPRVDGELVLLEGAFSLLDNPTEFKELELQMALLGDRATLNGGLILGGGKLDIIGHASFAPQPFVELALTGEKHTLLFPPGTHVLVSETIKLLATPSYLDVSGNLVVHQGELEHEELPEGGVALSDDVVVIGYSRPQPRPFDLSMDIQVDIEDHFKIVGSVVDVTVGGDLQLLQERGRPLQVFGNLNVVGGELRAYRQHLQVRRGTVAFSGAPENPSLDMRAERIITRENITVGLELGGTLEQPILEVYSDPVMPRTETLSYLLRGRGLDASAGADGTALALSMGASLMNQTGLLQKFDKLPGINGVEFSAEGGETDTTATVSGYIGNRIYLSYGVGLYEPINVLTAKLYLQSRLWIEVVSALENSLDLYYSFDIK